MLKHLLVFLGMLGSLVWAGHRLYYGPAHYTHLSQVLAGTVEHRDHGPVPAAYLDTKDHVLLYFAASWCAACQEVTPLLIRFYTTYASHQNFFSQTADRSRFSRQFIPSRTTKKAAMMSDFTRLTPRP